MAWSHVKQVLENDELRRSALLKTVPYVVLTGFSVVLFEFWNAKSLGVYPHYWIAAIVVGVGFPTRLNVIATELIAPRSNAQRFKQVLILWACLLVSFFAIWFFLQPT